VLTFTEAHLLLEPAPWGGVRDLLDESWFVAPPEELRIERLVARHVAFGRDSQAASAWALGPDQRNAE
jgi:pantothenate kinase